MQDAGADRPFGRFNMQIGSGEIGRQPGLRGAIEVDSGSPHIQSPKRAAIIATAEFDVSGVVNTAIADLAHGELERTV